MQHLYQLFLKKYTCNKSNKPELIILVEITARHSANQKILINSVHERNSLVFQAIACFFFGRGGLTGFRLDPVSWLYLWRMSSSFCKTCSSSPLPKSWETPLVVIIWKSNANLYSNSCYVFIYLFVKFSHFSDSQLWKKSLLFDLLTLSFIAIYTYSHHWVNV